MAAQKKEKTAIFLDNASATKVDDRVLKVMLPFFSQHYGNPSSVHSFSKPAIGIMEKSRQMLASLINSNPDEIYFTSCGTESNNMALWGIARAYRDRGKHIITSAIEHYSILNPLKEMKKEGWEITILPVDAEGLVDLKDLKKAIKKETVLVSIMHANNEIGTIQNIKEISKTVKESQAIMHCDCVATAGLIPLDVKEINIDSCSFTAQQMYGPKGVAALYLGKSVKLRPLLLGGVQERGRRAGTENIPAIAGFGEACRIAKEEMQADLKKIINLRKRLIKGIFENIEKVKLNGHPEKRLPGNVHLSFEYIEGESIILLLNSEGIAASSGSSCASHALKTSQVLTALNLPPELANGSVLFSIGKYNTAKEIDRVIDVMPAIVEKLRKISPLCNI